VVSTVVVATFSFPVRSASRLLPRERHRRRALRCSRRHYPRDESPSGLALPARKATGPVNRSEPSLRCVTDALCGSQPATRHRTTLLINAVFRTLWRMGSISSVNIGVATTSANARAGVTGLDKRPAAGAVQVIDPGPRGRARGGLAGDAVCDTDDHGGSDQAVYAYAVEDLLDWSRRLERPLPPGAFGENLTTRGIDLTGTRIGTRW